MSPQEANEGQSDNKEDINGEIMFSDLDVSVCYLIVVQVFESLQDLPRIEANGGFVVFQGSPFRSQECRQAPWKTKRNKVQTTINTV